MFAVRVSMLTVFVTFVALATDVSGGPILTFEESSLQTLEGDGFVMTWHWKHWTLTPEQLAILSARDDEGWHLGWFKSKFGASGPGDVGSGGSPEQPSWPSVVPTLPEVVPPFDGSSTTDPPLANPGPAVSAPEPSSLLLLASGLVMVARRYVRPRTR